MKEKIKEFLHKNETLFITMITMIIISKIVDIEIWNLHEVETEIIKHDYGRTFETIVDWKLYRLEMLENENNSTRNE